ncbi:MAG: dynamin family protein [Burkholderiaceae bacterium]|nr:dynamin family protein [Burkholderiaceae bacterium]
MAPWRADAVPPSFHQQFDQHGAWRRQFALRLQLLSEWMSEHELLDAAVQERLRRLEAQVRSDKIMVAFVAEFSRGKSELINALFFAGYGRRIMPASAGRTTMCPTELGYDAALKPSLRLLPIETRLESRALLDWRESASGWTQVDLDTNDASQLAGAMQKVAEVQRVTREQAAALGFWSDETPEDNPMVGEDGLVEVPRWRHALINIAHPLLKQGLVILDTPGLNAIGAEPELTVSLIPQAHAVVFILAADTGVTKSDMASWREHLITETGRTEARMVVLNKIDTLWDELSTTEEVAAQIDRQREGTATMLGVPPGRVLPVSAQKGLLAKISRDKPLLKSSNLPALEQALGEDMMGRRESILRLAVEDGIAELRTEAARILNIRRRDLAEQVMELGGLRGKNVSVIRHMRARIEQEQVEFEVSGAKIQAVRAVHLKLLREVFDILESSTLRKLLGELNHALRQPGIKLGVRRAYDEAFGKLGGSLDRVTQLTSEIQSMLAAMFRQLNAEYSFSLQVPTEPDMAQVQQELRDIEQSHLRYLGVGNIIRLAQPEFSDRLVRALFTRLRVLYDSVQGDIELWSKSAAAQLDAQLRERRRNFTRRLEAIERIQQAASGLDERLGEIDLHKKQIDDIEARLLELTSHLVTPPSEQAEPAAA